MRVPSTDGHLGPLIGVSIRLGQGRRLCQRIWQHFLLNLEKGTTLVLHYLDDFCIIGANEEEVRRVTEE